MSAAQAAERAITLLRDHLSAVEANAKPDDVVVVRDTPEREQIILMDHAAAVEMARKAGLSGEALDRLARVGDGRVVIAFVDDEVVSFRLRSWAVPADGN
jgi:hypothetical protein